MIERHETSVEPAFDVTVVVGTYGDDSWRNLAGERAIPSAVAQAPVIHAHGETLADARNIGFAAVQTPWVVFLDADDELPADYVRIMATGSADLRVPAVQYVRNGQPGIPKVPRVSRHRHMCEGSCLEQGNFICIGAAVRTALVRDVGGFNEYPWSEDWDLWLRLWLNGATIETLENATYIAHVRHDSRNRAPENAFKVKVHWDIHRANFPEQYESDVA